ncbi:MAG: LemA family protein [Methanomicrobiales archaeon]|nr:LemA family protein [Methanomicrobiales archaeon]MDD1654723.1 LemA family protein [Methanomicrobiales archaeon]
MDIVSLLILAVIVIVIIGLILWFIGIYNRFYTYKNAAEATLGQIRVAMKKRLDMIEQLLGAVKSYARFEKETLEKVTQMRASVLKGTPGELNTIERESRALLGTLIATAEAYPDLKTSTTVMSLMDSVKSLEEEIGRQRYTYNNIAQSFNTMMDTIPSNFVGSIMGLLKLEYLQFEEAIATPPKVEF